MVENAKHSKTSAVERKPAKHAAPESAKPYERWRRRAFITWAIIGFGIIFVAVLNVLGIVWQAAAVVIVAALITFLFHAPVDFLERKHIPRVIGSLICICGFLAVLILGVIVCIPNVISETQNFVSNTPDYISQIQETVSEISANGVFGIPADQLNSTLTAAGDWITSEGTRLLSGMAGGILGGIVNFGTGVAIFFIALICAFWLLIDLPKIAVEIRKIVPESHHDDLDILKEAFGTAVYGWLKATIVCAILTGVASFIVFAILGMPYSVVLAILCAILYVIPYIGLVIACILAGIVGLLVSPGVALLAVVLIAVITNVIANLIAPRLMGNSLSVHPVVIIVVIMIGGALCGVWGMLLAIPVAAALQAVFVAYFEARTGRELASEDGALFREAVRLDSAESLMLETDNNNNDEGEDD